MSGLLPIQFHDDSWGRSLGTLQVTRLRSDIDQDIGALRARALVLLMVTLLAIAALVQAGLHRSIVEPLRGLVAAMRRIREGDPDHRIQPRGPDELREVALSFNATMDSLGEAGAEISRRRDEERRLARELAEAERLAAVGELAAGVAHELGTPLGIVAGAARRLQRRPDPEETGELVRLIHDGVSRTESIVRQLMELGRRGSPRKRRLEVGSLTGSAVAAQRESALQRGVEVDRSPGDPSGEVQADPRQLSLALGHLIRNAIRAARKRVRVVSGRRDDQVFLRVEDDGPGVPPEIRSRIFDPFFTTRTPGEGTGLGLAVVEDVVRAHGGRVSLVRSALGGAGFEILLPACDP